VDVRLIAHMRDTLAHRGPDDKGAYIGPGVGLGHRRLSIIDLRPEGRQPMANEDGSVRIVFNGEIYNFKEHREWLLSRGHRFKSRTDTEVIIHLYEEMGVECLKLLRGMFAFAIWDEGKRLLFIARDRLGKKPLYYRFDECRFMFASEIKALLAHPSVGAEPDPAAINHYLAFGYVPGTQSAFKGIQKLPPAHYLTLCQGRIETHRYWRVHYLPKFEFDEREACEQIIQRLKEAVRLRMISDVPLGAFLSGGIDSSAVVAMMAQLSSKPVKTFSIGFNEPRYDERNYAREIARRFETEHYEFTVLPDTIDVLDKLVWHYDEPYADSSALPTYYLCKLAREHVTVALNGDAGDENFAGYPKYLMNAIAERARRSPAWARRTTGLVAALGATLFSPDRMIAKKLRALKYTLETEPVFGVAQRMMNFNAQGRRMLYSIDFAATVNQGAPEEMISELYYQTDADNVVDRSLGIDLSLYLPYDLLVKVDVASMAVGLEARSPMVDHEFVEFVARLPHRFKISGLTLKAIFKKALKGLLPKNILGRPKMGFGVPLDYWFRGELRDYIRDILLSQRHLERGYFRREAVEKLVENHVTGRVNAQYSIWNLLMLELWHRAQIDASVGADQTAQLHPALRFA